MTTIPTPVRAAPASPSAEERADVLPAVAGACAAAAGVIHLVVAPAHLAEARVIGLLFLALGLGQLMLALAFRWALPAAALLAAIGVHLVVVLLYTASRTVDLPFLPPHGPGHDSEHLPVPGAVGDGVPIYPGSRIEDVGPLDLTCLVAELVLVALMVSMLPARLRARVTSAMVALSLAAVVLRLVVGPD